MEVKHPWVLFKDDRTVAVMDGGRLLVIHHLHHEIYFFLKILLQLLNYLINRVILFLKDRNPFSEDF